MDGGKNSQAPQQKNRTRLYVHIGFSVLLFFVIMSFSMIGDRAVINSLFKAAGYTYGPLLGLFAYGLFTRLQVRETIEVGGFKVPALVLVCLAAPVLSFLIDYNSTTLLAGFKFGFLILAFNGLLTFLGLVALSDFTEVGEVVQE